MRRGLKILIGICVLLSTTFGGYCFGYFQGYVGGKGDPTAIESFAMVGILSELRNGDKDKAISLLESMLDVRLLDRGIYLSSAFQLDKFFVTELPADAIQAVRAYRERYPSQSNGVNVPELINKGLANNSGAVVGGQQ